MRALASGLGAAMLGPFPVVRSAHAAPFEAATVRQLARELASRPYKAPVEALPRPLAELKYDEYRKIRFRPAAAQWRDGGHFQVQFLHLGALYRVPVTIYLVEDGNVARVAYASEMFSFEGSFPAPEPGRDLGFSGFRLHTPMHDAEVFDEAAVFQGASYFRAVARDQHYGLSARGLAINTGESGGEEFPLFTTFWIEKPPPEATSIVVHALLDSPSCAAAYRFTIRPGDTTTMAVEAVVYPRAEMDTVGLAPLTSMYLFDANDRVGFDDYRPAVHDSDGLAIVTGRGEHIWRPLSNPTRLQISAFLDTNPVGFGMMQRQRSFADYQDLEARYERRPSLWVEPIGDWGKGSVMLIEIPSREEIHDNMVAFWRPAEPLQAGSEYALTYRLHWAWDRPVPLMPAWVGHTRIGGNEERRQFVIDFIGPGVEAEPGEASRAEVTAGPGSISNVTLMKNPETNGWRLAFSLLTAGADLVELRARLFQGDAPLSETWLYRWTSDAG